MRRAEAGKLGGTSGKGAKEDKEVKDVEQVKEGENAQLVWVPAIAWCRLLAGQLAPASHASRAGPVRMGYAPLLFRTGGGKAAFAWLQFSRARAVPVVPARCEL